MPKTAEGLSNGDSLEHDLDTDAGFNAHMAEKIAAKTGNEVSEEAKSLIESLAESDRSIKNGLTFGEESQPRDERGRFAEKPEPVAEQVEAEGAAPATEEREATDPVVAFLERHGGDANAALAAALKENENAQELLGRHSAEVGSARERERELSERLARLEGRVEAAPAVEQQPQVPLNMPRSRDEWEELIAGPQADGSGFAEAWSLASEVGDFRLLEQVKDIGKQYDPAEALEAWFDFKENLRDIMEEKKREEAAAKAPEAKPDPILARMHAQEQFERSLGAVQASKDAKDWALVAPKLTETLESLPQDDLIREAITSGEEAQQRKGLESLYRLARDRVVAGATNEASKEATASQERDKRAASVATGSLRPAPERQPVTPENYEERRAAAVAEFKRRIMEAPSTSVMENITYGK